MFIFNYSIKQLQKHQNSCIIFCCCFFVLTEYFLRTKIFQDDQSLFFTKSQSALTTVGRQVEYGIINSIKNFCKEIGQRNGILHLSQGQDFFLLHLEMVEETMNPDKSLTFDKRTDNFTHTKICPVKIQTYISKGAAICKQAFLIYSATW